jgi:predicted PurR-regulated permease PerM
LSSEHGSDVPSPPRVTGDGPGSNLTLPSDRTVRIAIVIIALLAVLAALAVSRLFAVPVILAFLLALVFSGPCRWLRRRGVPEPVTAAAIVVGLVVSLGFATALLAIPVSGWVQDAPRMARQVELKLRDISGIAKAVAEAEEKIADATAAAADDGDTPVEVVIEERGPLATVALGAPLIVAQTAFILILMFSILSSGSLFHERLVQALPNLSDKKRVLKIAYDVEREVSRYLLAITAINAALGVTIGLSLAALGMPNPLAFGLFAFAANFVPFLGAIVGIALSFAVALISLPTFLDAVIVAAVYFALTSLEGQVVTPWLVGRHLRLNTVVILVAVAFWAWLWSVMGMIMAVPLLVTFKVLCRHVDGLRPIGEFLSGRDT